MTGIERIAAERKRQVEEEGWTPEHDEGHGFGELTAAAICYLMHAHGVIGEEVPDLWPWEDQWWKPNDKIRDLERAGALVAAELDRQCLDPEQRVELLKEGSDG